MSENEVYDLGMRISRLRDDKKLSQKALSEITGISIATIYRYETNTQALSFDNAIKLAKALGTSLEYLAGLEDDTVVRLPTMTDEQKTILLKFISVFCEKQ